METWDSLVIKNKIFDDKYGLMPSDLEKANCLINRIDDSRTKSIPTQGDIIQCVGPKREYLFGHMEHDLNTKFGQICTQPYIPFASLAETREVNFNTSGGYWISCNDIDKFEYVGTDIKKFCTWGNMGGCASGTVFFETTVNVWKLLLDKIY